MQSRASKQIKAYMQIKTSKTKQSKETKTKHTKLEQTKSKRKKQASKQSKINKSSKPKPFQQTSSQMKFCPRERANQAQSSQTKPSEAKQATRAKPYMQIKANQSEQASKEASGEGREWIGWNGKKLLNIYS